MVDLGGVESNGATAARLEKDDPAELGFRLLFDASPIGIAIVGDDGCPIRVNRALTRTLGYSEAELCAMRFTAFTHPDDVPRNDALFDELVGGARDQYVIEKRYVRKDGAVAWGRVAVSLLSWPGRLKPVVVGMIEDVTEAHEAREAEAISIRALRERVKELSALHALARAVHLDAAPVPELLQRVVELLPPAMQFGDDTTARLRYGNLELGVGDHANAVAVLTAPLVTADGTTGQIEVGYRSAHPTEAEGPFLREERALLASTVEMVRAAIDERLAVAALRKSEEQLSLALTAAEMGVWEWDLTSDRVTWSPHLTRLVGGEHGFQGARGDFAERIHADDRQHVDEILGTAATSDGPMRFDTEIRLVRSSGDHRWVSVTGQVIADADGKPCRLLAVLADASRRKAMEESLRHAQRMDAIGRVAAGIAHDFNNLLMVIEGNCEMVLESQVIDDETRSMVKEVHDAGRLGTELTRQLLAFGRKSELKPERVDLVAHLRHAAPLLTRLAGREVRVEMDRLVSVGFVRADPVLLDQVLVNLVVNARDAMPTGGRVTIEAEDVQLTHAEQSLRPGSYVAITVRDGGCGMDCETRARVFEPFFTTKAPGKGTGLGLAVVFGVVKQSGGHIDVQSAPGAGTTFRILLPSA